MDIEVKRMSSAAIEMLDQLSIACKRFGVDYYAASQNRRDISAICWIALPCTSIS